MATHWPPRSPHEAMLSTPGGRAKLQRLAEQTSPSPSPSKLRSARSASGPASRATHALLGATMEDELDDDDEDEETLQLKLQAIQARLRLKRIQAAKERATESRPESAPIDARGPRGLPFQSKLAAARDRMDQPLSQNGIEVPASPVRKIQPVQEWQPSPQKILFGNDRGKRAADVSLKRAPSLHKAADHHAGRNAAYPRGTDLNKAGPAPQAEAARPLSFSERLAAARTDELNRQERQQKIEVLRSGAFGIRKEEMERYKENAVDVPDAPAKAQEYTRDQVLASTGGQKSGYLQRSDSALSGSQCTSETTGFESFSGYHLKRRILPHKVITRALSGKKSYSIQDLLRHVKAPDWSLPDVEADIVVFAILASKSDPRNHKPGPDGGKDRGRYMVVTLVDLKYEMELFLFNSGFDRFWKLTPGTVLAILNPVIMQPPKGREATGRFSLVINSDADTIIELGIARDLGYCKTVKKDGKLCNGWVNAKRTEYCEFHTNEAVRKTRASRIELTDGYVGGGKHQEKNWREKSKKKDGPMYDRESHTRVYVTGGGSMRFMGDDEREGGLADRKTREAAIQRRLAAKEKERDIARRLVEVGRGAGREYMSHATASTDGGGGGGGGGVVGPRSSACSSSTTAGASSLSWQALSGASATGNINSALGEARVANLALDRGERPKIDLGCTKRKRVESSVSQQGEVKAAFGWGAALKDKLGRMKDGERLDGRHSDALANGNTIEKAFAKAAAGDDAAEDGPPVRKKTRFVTKKGVREAGRESLGETLSAAAKVRRQVLLNDDDDGDDLIILK